MQWQLGGKSGTDAKYSCCKQVEGKCSDQLEISHKSCIMKVEGNFSPIRPDNLQSHHVVHVSVRGIEDTCRAIRGACICCQNLKSSAIE